jgi:beta-glucanase (GH16 family)
MTQALSRVHRRSYICTMMRFPFLICVSLFSCSCEESAVKAPVVPQPGEFISGPPTKLVWSDEFDVSGAPDATKWGYDLGDGCPNVCNWGNNELQYYTTDTANVRVRNGRLIIEARKEVRANKNYTSARLVSRNKGDWTYGRIEIKAKLPQGRGTWPAIWMLSTDWSYGGWPASGEIDIMEHVGFDPGVVHATIHTEAYNHSKGTQRGGTTLVGDFQSDFHVYAVDWYPDLLEFSVDGKKYFTTIKDGSDYKTWPFNQRFHLLMNIAVGGNWGGAQGVDDSIWPQRMEVDYVRVYQWK